MDENQVLQAINNDDIETLDIFFREYQDEFVSFNKGGYYGTFMHYAAGSGKSKTIEWLIGKGFDLNSIDSFGGSPLFRAIYQDHAETVCLLKKHGAYLIVPRGIKIISYIQFGISLIALSVAIFIIARGNFTITRALILFMTLGLCPLGIVEGCKGLMGKRTMAND